MPACGCPGSPPGTLEVPMASSRSLITLSSSSSSSWYTRPMAGSGGQAWLGGTEPQGSRTGTFARYWRSTGLCWRAFYRHWQTGQAPTSTSCVRAARTRSFVGVTAPPSRRCYEGSDGERLENRVRAWSVETLDEPSVSERPASPHSDTSDPQQETGEVECETAL